MLKVFMVVENDGIEINRSVVAELVVPGATSPAEDFVAAYVAEPVVTTEGSDLLPLVSPQNAVNRVFLDGKHIGHVESSFGYDGEHYARTRNGGKFVGPTGHVSEANGTSHADAVDALLARNARFTESA